MLLKFLQFPSKGLEHIKNVSNKDVCRRYTKFFGSNGDAAPEIAHDALCGTSLKNCSFFHPAFDIYAIIALWFEIGIIVCCMVH